MTFASCCDARYVKRERWQVGGDAAIHGDAIDEDLCVQNSRKVLDITVLSNRMFLAQLSERKECVGT